MQWDSEHCEWVVDGLKCGEDSCLALDSLDPGAHLIEMRYADEMGEFTVLDKATVMVRERSEAEWEYTALVARLDEQQAMARGQME